MPKIKISNIWEEIDCQNVHHYEAEWWVHECLLDTAYFSTLIFIKLFLSVHIN
jgi:hypothetical protein